MCFLGMTGYYRKFCKDLFCAAAPLTNLFWQDQIFHWDEDCHKAFMKIKTLLLATPVLVTPDFEKPFKLQVDSSDYSAGAVLLQERKHKNQRLLQWSLLLQEYNVKIFHIRG